ncbi:MAG: DNA repair protein RecN [Spirochaetaceae bacterium]|jgi:DNA repair protein RecN (Recombination protein N)|nr:DNA repair protein RecN [Spirochaetaceae bacterium]
MLEELSVRNYALIESLSLSFRGGLTILTGETGAGKSIIVGAISFLLGAKADAGVIRSGAEEASVSAVLRLGGGDREALDWLSGRDIPVEEDQGSAEVIIRRNIKVSGRGAMYIQNVPVTRNDLEEFTAFLVDLHGQHAHESLIKKENHRRYLDRFAGLEAEVLEFNGLFLSLSEKRKALEASLSSGRDRETRLELLNYGVQEIDAAMIRAGENRELEAEASRLGDYEKLAELVNGAAEALYDGETSVSALARRARNALDAAAGIDGSLSELRRRMEDLFYEAEDISGEFRSYREDLRFDPARLSEVEERLNLLYRLKKKYVPAGRPDISGEEAILAWREEALAEIEALTGWEENREALKAEISALEREITRRAQALTKARSAAAERFAQAVTGIIRGLGMPNAAFSVSVAPKGKEGLVIGQWGADEIEFRISANRGEPLKDLARIASGGELSRVMLAIKTVLSGAGGEGSHTLIFDEIDAGIGGEVALAVGEYLAKMGEQKQIFCVTHLASIAVRADNHFKVEKQVAGGARGERTVTTVTELSGAARREEVARMLAGDAGGSAALAHAEELLSKYGEHG